MSRTHTCEHSGVTFQTEPSPETLKAEAAAYRKGFIEGITKGFKEGYHKALLHHMDTDFAEGWKEGYEDAIQDFKCGYLPDRKLKNDRA